jgi:mycoredoxin
MMNEDILYKGASFIMNTSPETVRASSLVMYGTPWCGDCTRSRRWLEQNGVAYHYVDIEAEPEAVATVERLNDGLRSVPTIVFADGSVLVEPSNKALAAKLGF